MVSSGGSGTAYKINENPIGRGTTSKTGAATKAAPAAALVSGKKACICCTARTAAIVAVVVLLVGGGAGAGIALATGGETESAGASAGGGSGGLSGLRGGGTGGGANVSPIPTVSGSSSPPPTGGSGGSGTTASPSATRPPPIPPSSTSSPTAPPSSTSSQTPPPSASPTSPPSSSATASAAVTGSPTASSSSSPTPSLSVGASPSASPSPPPSPSGTPSTTPSASASVTHTATASPSPSPSTPVILRCRTSPCDVPTGSHFDLMLGSGGAKELAGNVTWRFQEAAPIGLYAAQRTGWLRWTPTSDQVGLWLVNVTETHVPTGTQTTHRLTLNVTLDLVEPAGIIWLVPFERAPPPRDQVGSLAQPLTFDKLHIKFCKNAPAAARQIRFRGGAYVPGDNDDFGALSCSGLNLSAVVDVRAWGNELPVLQPKGPQPAITVTGDYVSVRGLTLQGTLGDFNYTEAMARWWEESGPMNANAVTIKGHGVTFSENVVYDFSGSCLKTGKEADLFSAEDNIMFRCAWWSTKGTSGMSITDLDDAVPLPPGREGGTILRRNLVFAAESRIISHVFSKGTTTMEIDEGTALLIQVNAGSNSKEYIVEDNFFLHNGKGAALRAAHITLRRNTMHENGYNIAPPGAAGLRTNEGFDLILERNAVHAPPGQMALFFKKASGTTVTTCNNNLFHGGFSWDSTQCSHNVSGNVFSSNELFQDTLALNFSNAEAYGPAGAYGAPMALLEKYKAYLGKIGYEVGPSGFDIGGASAEPYHHYVQPMQREIVATAPQSPALEHYNASDALVPAPSNDAEWAAIRKIMVVFPDTNNPTGFQRYQLLFPEAATARFPVLATASPPHAGYVNCDLAYAKPGQDVECTPVPASGFAFSAWGGDCAASGSSTMCMLVDVLVEKRIEAHFVAL